jgi:hypothetical protein
VRALLLAALLGYVMPPASVIKWMAWTRDVLGLVSLKVEGTAAVPPAAAPAIAEALGVQVGQSDLQLSMTVAMRIPGRCRLELTSLESTKAVAAITNNSKRRSEGAEIAALQVAVDELCALLALRGSGEGESRAAIEKHLDALKVDTKVSWLGRIAGRVAYVIGANTPGASQLWVYKETATASDVDTVRLRPARVRFTDDKGSWDLRLLDYSSQSTGDWFPRVVEVYLNDALQLRLTTLNADARPKLDDKLF